MERKAILTAVFVSLAAALLATTFQSSGDANTVSFPESKADVTVEIADSPEEKRRGLMYREKLPIDQGMLFVYEDEDYRSFWMKNTLIPLDMIFIDSDGEIVTLHEAVPEPNTSDEDLTRYRSSEPAMYVLEVNSTFVEKNNIREGEKVILPSRFS
ncbi:DUF192 domain-containing protein [Candidatus Nanohalococcus occultus]|uniref:DUF192 domain-containing protein n=1 Tax=Candidatus Nanohalococcus occultus TaxID=2978047 RepID=UPI0039E0F853